MSTVAEDFPDLPPLDVLLRGGAVPSPADGPPRLDVLRHEPGLLALYPYPPAPCPPDAGRAYVRANMVSTIDGAAWGATGRSGSINNAADLRVFRALRALADVVLVGAGTVRDEEYTVLTVPAGLEEARADAGLPAHLETAVVTRSGDLPASFLEDQTAGSDLPSALVVTSARGARALGARYPADRVLVTGEDDVDLAAGLEQLAARGLTRVLCEGGPSLLGDLLAAGLVDELCLTTSPQVVGGPATRTVRGEDYLAGQGAARLEHLLHHDGVLLARWNLRQTPAAPVG